LSVVKGDKNSCQTKYVPAESLENIVLRRLGDLSQNKSLVETIVQDSQESSNNELPIKVDEKKRITLERGKLGFEMETLMGVLAKQGTQSKTYSIIMEKLERMKEMRDEDFASQ